METNSVYINFVSWYVVYVDSVKPNRWIPETRNSSICCLLGYCHFIEIRLFNQGLSSFDIFITLGFVRLNINLKEIELQRYEKYSVYATSRKYSGECGR